MCYSLIGRVGPVKVVRVGRSSRSSRFGSVNLCRLVPSDVELSLRPSSYVDPKSAAVESSRLRSNEVCGA